MELRDMFAIAFVCFVVQLVQCSAMSVSELEDFSNFLKKSSQLDKTLKKGSDPQDFDEDETVSDHAWEESGKFEGDLILNDRQRRTIVQDVAEGLSRNGLRDSTKRWPDNEVIYYIQKEHFNDDQVDAIQSGIDDIGRASCIKFRPYKKGDRNAVVIQGSRRGCFSQVGYQGGYQVLNLSGRHPVGRGCFRHGTVVHEMLHTLGFYHMQSSPDRDDYVDVVWENIVQPARHNFRKYNAFAVSDFGVGYDYDSVLHYSRRAFSNNGQDTIVPKQGGAEIGQRTGLSDKDTQKLNKMYCDAESNSEAEESTTKITSIKKKAPKNKPFDGHGIGYHQGKTVIIKLLPDEKAETYHIPSQPVYHMFDYFSKTPQVLSTKEIEGHGGKKSLAGPYKPYAAEENNTLRKTEVKDNKNIGSPYNVKIEHENTNKVDKEDENYDDTEKTLNGITEEKKGDSLNDNTDELYEAFNRLSDILKTHVYPSQTPDFSVYKLNTAYSDFSNPNKIPKIAYDFIPIYSKDKQSENDKKTSAEYIKSLYKDGPDSLISEKKQQNHENQETKTTELLEIEKENSETKRNITKEEEQSLRTSYPFKIHQHYSNGSLKIETPEYASYENLKDIHDYSDFYSPSTTKENTEDGKHYALFRKSVPTYSDWYQREELRQHPVDYNQELYTDNKNKLSKLTYLDVASESSEYDPENSNEYYSGSYSPIKKDEYKLFGASVPLTKDWYKVNHIKLNENYPYKYYHNAETSQSGEEINKDS